MPDKSTKKPRAGAGRRIVLRTGGVFAFVLVSAGGHAAISHADAASAAICGDVTGDGLIKSGDGLVTLHAAVGLGECVPPRCDVNQSGSITTSDALMILESAVGQEIALNCPLPPASTTTTSSSTSTSLSPTCGNGVVEPGEDCEEGFCRGGCNLVTRLCVDIGCSQDCTCPEPECGDAILDAGEGCDPPGSACIGGTCSESCECVP